MFNHSDLFSIHGSRNPRPAVLYKYVELLLGSLFANPSLQRADTLVLVPDPPDLPFGLLQLADGIDPVVE